MSKQFPHGSSGSHRDSEQEGDLLRGRHAVAKGNRGLGPTAPRNPPVHMNEVGRDAPPMSPID